MTNEPEQPPIEDLMTRNVMTVTEQQTVGRVRELMSKHAVSSFPVVNTENELVGIVTSTDVVGEALDETRVGEIMTEKTYTVPRGSGADLAARIMRMTGSRADPNDVLQEAFLAIYRYPTRFRAEKPNAFRNWSYSISRNTVLGLVTRAPESWMSSITASAPRSR